MVSKVEIINLRVKVKLKPRIDNFKFKFNVCILESFEVNVGINELQEVLELT